jgi:HAD superfamily hydrolase (TIGR01509 family)
VRATWPTSLRRCRYARAVLFAGRIRLPTETRALLLDLDGVLLDTLSMELQIVDDVLRAAVGSETAPVDRETVRRAFPLPVPDSWRAILIASGIPPTPDLVARLTTDLERLRVEITPRLNPGVEQVLEAARAQGLGLAVVSNNPSEHVRRLLSNASLASETTLVVGNDLAWPSKPAPEMYLAAAAQLGIAPTQCAAVEDSLIGAAAARAAGCFVIGVATGASTFAELSEAPAVDVAYECFECPTVRLIPGDITDKHLHTPNEFVSHMVELIAWRTGCSVMIDWRSDEWRLLGRMLGEQLAELLDPDGTARAFGLIDDGSAEIALSRGGEPGIHFVGRATDINWFLGLRVEQLRNGDALVALLNGMAEAAGLRARIDVCSVEDPHHTWEAIFRGLGLALRDLSGPLRLHAEETACASEAGDGVSYGLELFDVRIDRVAVTRTTAESVCRVGLQLDAGGWSSDLRTSPSVRSEGLGELLDLFASRAGLSGGVEFSALRLSSSHVVAEDVGMTIGAGLKALASERMNAFGIEGAGSSYYQPGVGAPVRVAVSFEGRKSLKLLPVGWSEEQFRRARLGPTLRNGLFSEDLDDFLDGFAGGLGASVMVHWEPTPDLDTAWRLVFGGLGSALAQLLAPNHTRRRLIAGVKATLV